MSKQPRLQKPVLHTGATEVNKFVFVSLATRETDTGVEWSGKIVADGRVVSYVSNSGLGGAPNEYQVVDREVFDRLVEAAEAAYPDASSSSVRVDLFVLDLWADSLEVRDGGEAVASLGF